MRESRPQPTTTSTELIDEGPRRASVSLALYDRWVIEAIRVQGLPSIGAPDQTFETREKAVAYAREVVRGLA